MRANILFSGSKGNCTYISDGETAILVDAGGTLKRIRESIELLGDDIANISGIFITHEHTDHVQALYTISKKYNIKIYTTVETARAFCAPNKKYSVDECKRLASNVMTVKPSKTYEVGTMSIKVFETPHDTMGSIGFVFTSSADNKSLGYATDIGYVTDDIRESLSGVKNIVIESNHDVQMLKDGPYPEYLKERILSERGHLSNDSCSLFMSELAMTGSRSFTLAHLSEENNMPSLALECAQKAVAQYDGAVVKVASAYTATEIEIM